MIDLILIHGDKALFERKLGAAVVMVRPGTLKASGPATLRGKKVCVEGDEGSVEVKCQYISGAFVTPGKGTLTIKALAKDQVAEKTKTGDKLVMLKGSKYTSEFTVESPAKNPKQEPDPTPKYTGSGQFSTRNRKFRGT